MDILDRLSYGYYKARKELFLKVYEDYYVRSSDPEVHDYVVELVQAAYELGVSVELNKTSIDIKSMIQSLGSSNE